MRIAQNGAQILLAFLFALAFTPRFSTITSFERALYVTTLLFGAGAMALLIAPAVFHRITYRHRLKHRLVGVANRFTICGMVLLLLTISSSLFLILEVVVGMMPAVLMGTLFTTGFVSWWFVLPMWYRSRHSTA